VKPLKKLLSGLTYVEGGNLSVLNRAVSEICLHSSKITKDGMFAAFHGSKSDGFLYVNAAIANGAGFILCDTKHAKSIFGNEESLKDKYADVLIIKRDSVVFLFSDNVRKTFSQIVSNFYAPISADIVGITGTNGKSSVADFLRQLWFLSGRNSASIGTLGVIRGEEGHCRTNQPVTMTTPDIVSLYSIIKSLIAEKINRIALEVSSHSLDQYRIDGLTLKTACFTNLSQDHLDYHGDMNNYWQAKKRLFTEVLTENSFAVINFDVPQAAELIKSCRQKRIRTITYGKSNKADIYVENVKVNAGCQTVKLSAFGKVYDEVRIPLVGDFQLYNVLCAIATLSSAENDDLTTYIALLPRLKSVPGRVEFISYFNEAAVYTDFAHTPDGFINILSTLRFYTQRKLKIVFGCGGDRDKGKRPLMGKIACEMADEVFVTDDNPRNESPEQIRREIISGGDKSKIIEVSDRKEAIAKALKTLQPGDLLVVAGKGHEHVQILADRNIPFNDGDIIRSLTP
jgi:UDP-N-acetylmuramoyl-L-alanyl-D-glutamate--2,6-diaminopimelate ligase